MNGIMIDNELSIKPDGLLVISIYARKMRRHFSYVWPREQSNGQQEVHGVDTQL